MDFEAFSTHTHKRTNHMRRRGRARERRREKNLHSSDKIADGLKALAVCAHQVTDRSNREASVGNLHIMIEFDGNVLEQCQCNAVNDDDDDVCVFVFLL